MPPIPGGSDMPAPARAVPAPEPKAEPRRPASPDATVVFRPGRLTPMNPEAGIAPTMLSLKPISIGSDNSCDVRLSGPNIQRKQVEITLSRSGFMLKDVGGGGVVSIDGLAVTEQLLRDGDAVQIGAARFSFKLA
jgi:pSer/pThr/pTyr-binding forkhead associated (FHA) protein